MKANARYLMTQSLLASWEYRYAAQDSIKAREDFLATLRRERSEPNAAMKDGLAFEELVTAFCEGRGASGHHWERGVAGVGSIVMGGQFQVKVSRAAEIDGIPLLLYGRLDVLRAGTIYDIKFSRAYRPGKYLSSPQHPMYFACEPAASRFVYVISDGWDVCTEEYRREETPPITETIHSFLRDLQVEGLLETYFENWRCRY